MMKHRGAIYASCIGILFLISCSLAVPKRVNEDQLKKNIIINTQVTGFPDREYNITNFGAANDSSVISTKAINEAIRKCSDEGGGSVIVPSGVFLTGAVVLKSNVNLHLEKGATLRFSTNPQDYLPLVRTRWEGIDCYNYAPLIYAYQEENIAITGEGTLDGQAGNDAWWPWKGKKEYAWSEGMPSQLDNPGRPKLMEFESNGSPLEERKLGEGSYLRPPFIQFYQCKRVLIDQISIINSPFWVIHPLLSESLIIHSVNITSHGPNNDGIDPESCKNVIIDNCFFDTGDDCIAIKSGRNNDGRKWNIPSENILISKCRMKNGHGGVAIGSEISGGCRNILVEDCTMDSPELERAIRIKSNTHRGGIIEDIYFRNLTVGEVKDAVFRIECNYEMKKDEKGKYPPVIRNIYVSQLTSKKSKYAVFIEGLQDQKSVYDIYFSNISFKGVKQDNKISQAENVVFKDVKVNGKVIKK